MLSRIDGGSIQIGTIRCPRDESRCCDRIDFEPSRFRHVGLFQIWPDDFQVTLRSQRDQRVACSTTDVLPSSGCAHAEAPLEIVNGGRYIESGQYEVINALERGHRGRSIARYPSRW